MGGCEQWEATAMAAVLCVALGVFGVLGGFGAAGSIGYVALTTPTSTVTASPRPTRTATPTATRTATPQPTATPTPAPWRTTELRVAARSSATVQIPLQPGQLVDGVFGVNQDVGFAVLGPGGSVVLDWGRVRGPRTFSVTARVVGDYILRFDNTYSIFTSKTVQLSYSIR